VVAEGGSKWRRAAGLLWAAALLLGNARAENWPSFRGPRGDGVSGETEVPLTWSASENIAWKRPIPGRGHASPILWDERLFVVSAAEERGERLLICLERRTGRTLWQRAVLTAPLEPIHSLNSYASSTPATDGERVYVSFLDRDRMFVAAYDFSGNRLWEAHPGPFASKHGYCSSPVLWRDLVILNGDHDGNGFLVALDRRTGRTVWRTPRPNNTRSYCTPLIRAVNGRPLLMMSGSKCVAAYDPATGAQRWIVDGPTEQFVAAPAFNGRLLFITAGYPERHIVAIRPDGRGNVTRSHVAWRTRRGCAYVPSPVVVGDYLLVAADGGFATCFMADTGETLWTERLGGGHSASPVVAAGRVYFQSDRGVTTVVRPGRAFVRLAVNELGEETYASPAVSQGQVFLRGVRHLYAIGAVP
jgi:hypothetical protein